ncbi:TPA: hypothetical protein NDY72_000292 [Enterobacter cloacae]|uniref:hypothetical protein n=1 Tax=Enterobacter cloacae TaxID=550 RepID=UPI00211BCF7C|nr:hypothetical protein [Enterobacter cloacae]MCQ9484361.1 hypothetical protein [Enterobacter cloacae]MCQ9527471.1 hypothetical protein [Enterobacter cloacae]MCQ9570054.1 hypothetical protein [Enterobacter cloacae]HCD7173161.1 hypothetical protein [Enterobacter cloacae]HDC4657827.1 hypothetical protein [Enterobacter cloacae]
MKLINYLLSESKKGWEWPSNVVKAVVMEGSRVVHFYFDYACPPSLSETLISLHPFTSAEVVTSQQYKAALVASKPEWDGEGLPLVGAEVQCICNQFPSEGQEKLLGKILYSGEYTILHTYKTNEQHHVPVESVLMTKHWSITPIRSQADKKRDEAVESIKAMLMYDYGDDPRLNDAVILYDAIAAGKIPHIRID